MKNWIKNIALGCLIGFSVNGFSQEGYSYKRKIELQKDTLNWNSVELPDEMYDKIKSDLSDIRIFGLKDNDTIEVPYLVSTEKIVFSKIIHSKIINQSKTNEGYYFTIENLYPDTNISKIQLNFSNENFNWEVNLEGSHNQNEWFTILEDYRVLSIKNPQTNYRFEQLAFGSATYKYYRIFIKTTDKPEIISASLNLDSYNFNSVVSRKIDNLSFKNEKENKSSIIEFSSKTKLPVISLKIEVNDDDFDRPIRIEYLKDSIKTEKGWIKNYDLLYSGTISTTKKDFLTVDENILVKDFRIIIENRDNAPLSVESVELFSFVHSVYFKTKEQTDYYLFYGHEKVNKPQYDIEKFRERIINEPKIKATLSDEILIPKKVEIQQKPLFESKLWLWVIMILIIGILGYFSLKMLKKE